MKNRRIISGVVTALLLSCATATPATEVSTESVNPQNLGLSAASYGLFSYKNDDALIKSVKIIQQLGYQSNTPADGLSLDSYRGASLSLHQKQKENSFLREMLLAH